MLHQYYLAPMAEISTPALRLVVKELAPQTGLFSEMLSAPAIAANAQYNEPLIRKYSFDDDIIYQLVGSDPQVIQKACLNLEKHGAAGIDLNMGCGAPNILCKGAGAALLNDFPKTTEIIKACRQVTSGSLSVKMRTGYQQNDLELVKKFISMFAAEGVNFITIHPRYCKQHFKFDANHQLLAELAIFSPLPIIANGDITSVEKANSLLSLPNVSAVMVAREAVKRPWIFSEIASSLQGKEKQTFDLLDVSNKILDFIETELPKTLHKSRILRFSSYFCKNFAFSHQLFTKISREPTPQYAKRIFSEYLQRNPHERYR